MWGFSQTQAQLEERFSLGDHTDPDRPGDAPRQPSSSDLDDVRVRLDALDKKLDGHRPEDEKETAEKSGRSDYALAVRVSSDFIAAIFVGAALGWGLDKLAGTAPFGLVILLLLGFAAGVLNVMRTLGLVSQAPSSGPSSEQSALARRRDTGEKDREGR
ncbi:MAG: hypothetical protein Rhims3KO_02230 [Hyphomicrobiales bacterium]